MDRPTSNTGFAGYHRSRESARVVRIGWTQTADQFHPQKGICTMFSRTGMFVVGALLLITVMWTVYSIGDVAIERWFG